jgi:hypothetical protein
MSANGMARPCSAVNLLTVVGRREAKLKRPAVIRSLNRSHAATTPVAAVL